MNKYRLVCCLILLLPAIMLAAFLDLDKVNSETLAIFVYAYLFLFLFSGRNFILAVKTPSKLLCKRFAINILLVLLAFSLILFIANIAAASKVAF